MMSTPFPISHGLNALARQSVSVEMKRVAQRLLANTGSPSPEVPAMVTVTSLSLGSDSKGEMEGSRLTFVKTGSLVTAFEDFAPG
jgi:hypothetical protein